MRRRPRTCRNRLCSSPNSPIADCSPSPGVPENAVEPVLLVECPRLLFPFARNILADVTREGGFPPVLLQPIDFVSLWHARRQQQNEGTVVA